METIELRVTDAASKDFGHLYIIYTNNEGKEFVIRGGPGPLSVFGNIDVEIGPYSERSRDWVPPAERSLEDTVVLESGEDLEEKYLKMAFFAQLVEQSEVDYDTLAAVGDINSDWIVNSNGLVSAALASVDINITKEDLPPSERRRPAAGFENRRAFEAPVSEFLSTHFDDAAGQHAAGYAAVYQRLEDRFVQKHKGQIHHLDNRTNRSLEFLNEVWQGTPDGSDPSNDGEGLWDELFGDSIFPEHIAEDFGDVDWRATEDNIRRLHRSDPALASSILGELATARSLGMPWKKDFARKYGGYFIYLDGSATPGGEAGEPDRQVPLGGERTRLYPDASAQDVALADLALDKETAQPGGHTIHSVPGRPPVPVPDRETSFDRYRQLGMTAEEEAEALEEHAKLWKQSFLDMGGDEEAAEALALARFSNTWGLTEFASEAKGVVFKHPVEKVYPATSGTNRDYIRKEVEGLLATLGITARRWSLMPNAHTGSDWKKGGTDDEGFGPRMTLTYTDEIGEQILVTNSFQANVRGAFAPTSDTDEIPSNEPVMNAGQDM